MKILYLSNHFALASQPGAPRPWKVAQYLSRKGHDITAIVNHRHYLDERIKVGSSDPFRPQIVDDVKVVGVKTTAGRRKSRTKRVVNYFAYSLGAVRAGFRLGPFDLIITGTPPLLAPLAGILLGRLWGAFTVLEVRDLHPEKAIALGLIRSRLVAVLWASYEHLVRKLHHHIVAVEPSTHDTLLKKRVSKQRITLIPNGIDTGPTQIGSFPGQVEKTFSLFKNWTKITYGGGMGYGNYLMPILESAPLVRHRKIVFLFFGEGELKPTYQGYIRKQRLQNVIFFPAQTRQVIHSIFRRSDILVYSTPRNQFFSGLLTNKIFEYHGAGKPIVFAGEGIMADMIRAAGSGMVVPPEDRQAIADAFCHLSKHPELAHAMGESGRSYILKHHNRNQTFRRWERVMLAAATYFSKGTGVKAGSK